MMIKYSIIIPVYNRPDEVKELLASLTKQTFKDFEVVIVEDGSTVSSEDVIASFDGQLTVRYFKKENEGQGFARNFGFEKANGEYFIVFDSDCLIPSHYLESVEEFLNKNRVEAFGGPDASHPTFSTIQKAISQTMTSFLTTGGMRGKSTHVGKFHPRSFNMGISREVYEKTKGYLIPFMGEDMEFSVRLIKEGFSSALITEAFVYHKRRTDPIKFFKQLQYFGRARINLSRFHKDQIGLMHLFPFFFSGGFVISLILPFLVVGPVGFVGLLFYTTYLFFVAIESLIVNRSLKVAVLTPLMTMIQMTGYGYGLVYEWVRKLRGINPNTKYIELY
jgi:glycosyltransferase involved in cell wall biosynthesis